MMPPVPRRKSSAIYERLLRGQATAAEYVAAVRAETREAAAAWRPSRKHHTKTTDHKPKGNA